MTETATAARLLGDPTRVRIIEALSTGPLRTAELAAAAGMSPAALSRHLNLLRGAGVVSRVDVDGDGRGRAYQLHPAALDELAGWLRATRWTAELAGVSDRPRTQDLLSRVGGFLDAFTTGDVGFFERHLRADALMVFPDAPAAFDKQACLDSVGSHPPYRQHRILDEPAVRDLAGSTTVITFTAEVATDADAGTRAMFVTAVLEEGQPWRLVHLQWTARPPDHPEQQQRGSADA